MRGNFASRKHGHAATRHHDASPEYKAWRSMKDRCRNLKARNYSAYGGRGIQVCERWAASFENFLADMGLKPNQGYSLERKNNAGNYEPGNCCWATPKQQALNRRSNHNLTVGDQTFPLSVWARKFGITKHALRMRLLKGMSVETALTTPLRRRSAA